MYNHQEIEKKWQKHWEENEIFKTNMNSEKPRFYSLDMFPYPSGSGLHVGHLEGYTATDIISRFKRMNGYEVLHPMGWDAFGLPAEQFAIKTGNHPQEFTKKNIENFKKQIKSIGFSYDWSKELSTTDPKYYKWTQWIFTKLYEKNLAELKDIPVNFCPECKTVLANEEVVNGKCERAGHVVIKKNLKQWSLKISQYSERLLNDLDDLSWPENLKNMQRNWIGKSIGAEIDFPIENNDEQLKVYTTRPDTIYGVTYIVLAIEHKLTASLITDDRKIKVESFIETFKNKSDLERTDLNKDKSGIFTGSYAIHPLTGEKVEIWLADYVLSTYGTGVVMAVPAHDQRDYEFAKKYNLEMKQVISGDLSHAAVVDDGEHFNSEEINGLNNVKAIAKICEIISQRKIGKQKTNYKLRDWIFSRQRYWGEPFPVAHMEDGSIKILDKEELPVELPFINSFQPDESGNSALNNAKDWMNYTDPVSGLKGLREINTMPQWAGSSWYYLRYLDPENEEELVSKELADKWLPVDLYIGGAEHAVLHLLYARFWHKVLYDIGVVSQKEPFEKIINQGMILGSDNEKMSKSKGNVVSPDVLTEKYGADTIRMYEMFMGPLESAKPWSDEKIGGIYKFIDKLIRVVTTSNIGLLSSSFSIIHNQTIKKVTDDYEKLSFNTAISQLMIYINNLANETEVPKEILNDFIKLINPIIPHVAEELWESMGNQEDLSFVQWPIYDESKLEKSEVEIILQVNGKVKKKLFVSKNITQSDQLELAKDSLIELIAGKDILKEISVPGKLVNIVFK